MDRNRDWANRNADIHWPAGFTPDDADLFAHNEMLIKAPCATVWRHLVEAPKWPQWYPNSQNVRIIGNGSGLLQQGTKFEFDTFGLHVVAQLHEFDAQSRLGWFGKGVGIDAYHTWLLIPRIKDCYVVTEEVAKGPGAIAIRKPDPDAMHKGHELWLEKLKSLSEKQ
jgi:hypothetical protein